MKCSKCNDIIENPLSCQYCPELFCSIPCLESHYNLIHNLNLFHKAQSQSQSKSSFPHSTLIISIFLVKGILNTQINYDNLYSLDNFIPVYQSNGKIKTIGSGSYGQVYLGMNIIDKKYYAIKHMDKKNIFAILNSLLNIQKEIDIQSKIAHPNIVKLLYVKETESCYDLIMEYAKNGNLFHYIRRNRCLSEDESFSIFIQVVNAINFLHENDLIHRDIKPENILLFENNIVKLCDFGWCVKLNGYQRGTFCVTTEYMSPELVNHEGYGKEIDTWSLGVLLYEMIHGYSPFKPNKSQFEPEDVMENIVNHNIKFKEQVSDRCKKLIYGLLDSNIYKRYTVEDIFSSEFVKYYEEIELNKNKFSFNNYKPNSQINNIIYSPQIEMNNNINIHMSMDYNNYIYNIEMPQKNNSYDFINHNQSESNINTKKVNKGLYENYIKSANNSKNYFFNNNSFGESNAFQSSSNFNDNFYESKLDSKINFENNVSNDNENIKKQKNINLSQTDNQFFKDNYPKSNVSDIIDIYSSYNIENHFNAFDNIFKEDNQQEQNINSNNNYFFEEKNFNNNNNNDNEKILKISYLSNNDSINNETKKKNEGPQDKTLKRIFSENYIFNNSHFLYNDILNKNNKEKLKLIKNELLNITPNNLSKNLSFSSIQPPERNFSEIKSQNFDSIFTNNITNIKTPNKNYIEINFDNYKSYKKNSQLNNTHNNRQYISKSEISDLTEIKEKEPIDNIHKRRPASKEGIKFNKINISLSKKNQNYLIKNIKMNNNNQESIKSNINIYKNFNFNQPKNIVLTEIDNTNKYSNIIQEKSENKKEDIPYIKYKKLNNKTSNSSNNYYLIIKTNSKNSKERLITNYIYKPKNDIEKKSNIYYKTEIKNSQINTRETKNLYLSKTPDDIFDKVETTINEFEEPKKENIHLSLNYIEPKINIHTHKDVTINNVKKIIKKNLITKTEEKKPKNNKKKRIKENINQKSHNNKTPMRDVRIVKINEIYLGNSHSEINIKKPLIISKSKNIHINNKVDSSQTNNISYINKSNLLKKGIKKIYVYNKQLKNIHEKEKSKIPFINLKNFKNIEKNKIDDKPYDNRNKKEKIIKYKHIINKVNEKESNIINNQSYYNDKNEDRNKTPKKKSIFNQINPNILIESFKKELENKEKLEKIKSNVVKKSY